jgi:hypothetical protein
LRRKNLIPEKKKEKAKKVKMASSPENVSD